MSRRYFDRNWRIKGQFGTEKIALVHLTIFMFWMKRDVWKNTWVQWYFVSKMWEKIILLIQKKTFDIRGLRPRFCKTFVIPRIIYVLEQWKISTIFETEYIHTWRFLRSNTIRAIEIQVGKNIWGMETCRKSKKNTWVQMLEFHWTQLDKNMLRPLPPFIKVTEPFLFSPEAIVQDRK